MQKRPLRKLRVSAINEVCQNLRRITLRGEDLEGFPADETGGYIKLNFHDPEYETPLVRTYTVRDTRLDQLEIDVDFVLHEHGGPAAKWAMNAEIGSEILIGGPGPKKTVPFDADWYLLAGDMTALPAISINLEELSRNRPDATGYAILEVLSEQDTHTLIKPEGIELVWVIDESHGKSTEGTDSALVQTVKNIDWRDGKVAVWTACEFDSMKQFRKFYLKDKGLIRKEIYISSYWKDGVSEDQHKVIKRKDAAS